jgi:selenocysteine-specific elongation factor
MTPEAARARLGLPERRLAEALAGPPVEIAGGLLRLAPSAAAPRPGGGDGGPQPSRQAAAGTLPDRVADAVAELRHDLADRPFAAPEAGRLRELGLEPRAVAAAERAGLLLRITDQIVLAPGAEAAAARVLAGLPQPFTAAEARQALGTTRRVAIPLLEYLDRAGITRRLPDDRRSMTAGPGANPG